jgi:RNA polymerase sigma-70 factor (ECF subfamily)
LPNVPRHAAPSSAQAFQDRLSAHRGIVLKVAASYAWTCEDRADLAQDIALQLWRAWPGYDPARPFATWMYRVALNVAISHRRSESQRGQQDPLHEGHDQLVGEQDVDAAHRQQRELLQHAMRALGRLDRALLLLHLEGCSHREIGDVLGLSESNAATRLGRIREKLRHVAGEGPQEGDRA